MECSQKIDYSSMDPDVLLVFEAFKEHCRRVDGKTWDTEHNRYADLDGLKAVMTEMQITMGQFEKFVDYLEKVMNVPKTMHKPHLALIVDFLRSKEQRSS
ncbi:MAG: hypothetical protein KGI60_03800 [Patescibacteria group bacterium]|nr:hypothetical protein [Patescibacteria group bacterium]